MFTCPKEKVVLTSVCCFFHSLVTYSLNNNAMVAFWCWNTSFSVFRLVSPRVARRHFLQLGQGSTLALVRWPEASRNQQGSVNHMRYWPWGPIKNTKCAAYGYVMKTSQNSQIPYRYINFFCDTVYVKDYLKLLAHLATTSEQLVSIPVGSNVTASWNFENSSGKCQVKSREFCFHEML